MKETSSSLKRGAWTAKEDDLLRNCIAKYGVGKWHLVPIRAGLNRCRKSCRLRWLNHLNPSIKRGPFEEDEVDLIIRLHNLLGNRWSLIAGRIPGRTSNDVKNFFNAHLQKIKTNKAKTSLSKTDAESKGKKPALVSTVIKPRPQKFSIKIPPFSSMDKTIRNLDQPEISREINNDGNSGPCPWPDNVFVDKAAQVSDHAMDIPEGFWIDDQILLPNNNDEVAGDDQGQIDDFGDLSIDDMDIWNMLN